MEYKRRRIRVSKQVMFKSVFRFVRKNYYKISSKHVLRKYNFIQSLFSSKYFWIFCLQYGSSSNLLFPTRDLSFDFSYQVLVHTTNILLPLFFSLFRPHANVVKCIWTTDVFTTLEIPERLLGCSAQDFWFGHLQYSSCFISIQPSQNRLVDSEFSFCVELFIFRHFIIEVCYYIRIAW